MGSLGFMFTCAQCGRFFLGRATYCSGACRQKAYRQRRDEWPATDRPLGEVGVMVGRLRRHVQRLDDAANRGAGVRLRCSDAQEISAALKQVIDGLIGA
jgi:hypothetical protein